MIRLPVPWGNVVGIARTLLALALMVTVVGSSTTTLFRPVAGLGEYPLCEGVARVGIFCLVGGDNLGIARAVCAILLAVVASGWRPRFTAIPLAWIALSVSTGIAIPEGGDQIASNLAMLLAVVGITDGRRWHWEISDRDLDGTVGRITTLAGVCAYWLAKLQISILYLQASLAKLPHGEWADGTAVYYWLHHPVFGVTKWSAFIASAVVEVPLLVVGLTWGTIAIEFALALVLLLPRLARPWIMGLGAALHLGIGFTLGLWSFSIAMLAALLVLVPPVGASIRLRRRVSEQGEEIAVIPRGDAQRDVGSEQQAVQQPGRIGG